LNDANKYVRSAAISVVIPVYNGASTIGPLVDTLVAGLAPYKLQVVLVNDGSKDNSHQVCEELFHKYPDIVTYLRLARNFGEHNAVMAGLRHSRGDYTVIMDDDFQNPPEEVISLVQEAERGDFDVVYSYYEQKRHHWLRNIGSTFNGWVAHFMLNKPKGLYLSSFKCLNRFLTKEVVKYDAPLPYIDGVILSLTDNIGTVRVHHNERVHGKSGYTFRKLVRLWLSMFVNFSIMPLRLSLIMGFVASLLALGMAVEVVLEKLLNPGIQVGWASLAFLILLFAGVQLCILGLMGEYIGRTLLNSNRLPQFVVRSTFENDQQDDRTESDPTFRKEGRTDNWRR
jgi:glycosyltransferase involved in cell wall biosynthesis